MNREIKFRAWNTEMNNMVFPSLEFGREIWPCTYRRIIKSDTDKDGHTEQVVLEMVSVDHILQSPEYDIMQYTGLKDRNGKEIYEGDIVRLEDMICPITWDDGAYQMITSKNQGRSDATQDRLRRFEVIGNIYENPELL